MGDAIQLCRYIPLLAQRGARVLFAIKPPLARLMRTLEGPAALLTQGDPIIPFDVHTSLLELPHLLHTTLNTIPATVPYLRADPVLSQQWAQRLSSFGGRKVGLVWAGAREHQNDRNRSMSLKMFEPLLRTPGFSWVSLQKDRAAEELTSLPRDVQMMDCGGSLNDFADTAALMQNLDLLISVDTAPIHLFAAMGKPTWVLLPFMPDWRWMLNRSDSPWYPTMKLFRQPTPGDWNTPLTQIARELR
jgi:hypothetical protein